VDHPLKDITDFDSSNIRYTRLTSKRYNAHEESEPEPRSIQKMQKTLLDINPEGDLLREIKDIMDELFIMTQIKTQEQNVARNFVKHVQHILRANSTAAPELSTRNQHTGSFSDIKGKLPSVTMSPLRGSSFSTAVDPYDWDDSEWTMECASDLMESIGDQLLELGYLKDAAQNTSNAVCCLTSLSTL
jgi:hypothetical protein